MEIDKSVKKVIKKIKERYGNSSDLNTRIIKKKDKMIHF